MLEPLREPQFRIRCLGSFRLVQTADKRDVTPAARKARALLAYLSIVQKPIGRGRLVALLWSDRGEEQARASLRQTIHEQRWLSNGRGVLRIERDYLAIGGNAITDIAAIEAAAKAGDLERLCRELSDWQGDFLEDLASVDPAFDEWLQSTLVPVHEALLGSAADAARLGMERGDIARSRRIVNLLQQRDAANEVVLRLGLQLDRLAGDSVSLHRRYGRFRDFLKTELDAAPSTETQHLYRELASDLSTPPIVSAERPGDLSGWNPPGEKTSAPPSDDRTSAPKAAYIGEARKRHGRVLGASIAAAMLTIALIALSAWSLWPAKGRVAPPPGEPLLAVLPFQSLTADSGSRYFSNGITQEIVDTLLQQTEIRVAATSASFRFRNPSDAAKALAATHVLSGSVQRDGSRLRLIAQLADVRRNRILWSRAYDRTVVQTPRLQHDVALQVANALEMRLSENSLSDAQKIDPVAYDHYLRGREMFRERTDIDAAASELELAVRLAPDFARAWSTLAAVRYVGADFEVGQAGGDRAIELAQAAARRALALNPRGGEALGVLAGLGLLSGHRLLEIDRLFERALAAEPNNTQLLNWYSGYLGDVGRDQDKLYELTRAYELDRVTPSIAENLIQVLSEVGWFDKANEIIAVSRENAREGDVFYQHDLFDVRSGYFLLKRDWSGMAGLLAALPGSVDPREAEVYRLSRDTAVALEMRDKPKFGSLRARWAGEKVADPTNAVGFLVALGHPNDALDVIETFAESNRSRGALNLAATDLLFSPNAAAVRRDPRVPALLAKWGFFDYWSKSNNWPDFCREPGLPFDCKAEAQRFARRT